jgi:thiol-disulfide isomerase/thioredoxin
LAAPPEHPVTRPAGRRRARPVFLLIGVVVAAGLAVGLFTGVGTGTHSPGRPQAGGAVPTFALPRLGGGAPVGVPADGGGNGHPAVVVFFASWCGPCKKELPALAAAYHRQQAAHSRLAKVALIGVDGDITPSAGQQFADDAGVTFPVGSDEHLTVTQTTFDFHGYPEAIFVNADGTVAAVHYGAITTAQLVQWERRLLTGG